MILLRIKKTFFPNARPVQIQTCERAKVLMAIGNDIRVSQGNPGSQAHPVVIGSRLDVGGKHLRLLSILFPLPWTCLFDMCNRAKLNVNQSFNK